MFLQIQKYGLLLSIFRAFTRIGRTKVLTPAPLPLKRDVGPFYFYSKGGERILCNPPQNLPKYSSDKPSTQKIRVLTYILSEHKFLFLWPKALQFYPNFAPNLRSYFNGGNFHSHLIPSQPKLQTFPSSICPPVCYPQGEKNLTRRVQNDRIGILPVEPDNLPVYGAGGGGDFCVYKENWGESKAVP